MNNIMQIIYVYFTIRVKDIKGFDVEHLAHTMLPFSWSIYPQTAYISIKNNQNRIMNLIVNCRGVKACI